METISVPIENPVGISSGLILVKTKWFEFVRINNRFITRKPVIARNH